MSFIKHTAIQIHKSKIIAKKQKRRRHAGKNLKETTNRVKTRRSTQETYKERLPKKQKTKLKAGSK